MITPMDLTDGATVDWAYRVKVVCEPDEPDAGPDRFGSLLRHIPAGDRQWAWRAGDDGFALLRVADGSGSGSIRLYVEPARRHRGTGRALWAALLDQANAVGCRTLQGRYADDDATRFCAAVGAVEGVPNLRGLLLMPAADVGAPVDGYVLRSWVGRTPEELMPDMAHVRDAINDAPSPTGVEPDVFTPERVRAAEEAVLIRGLQLRLTVALDAAGRMVGYTELRVGPEPDALATTEETAVLKSHRRRGLATWIKAESLRQLGFDRPDVTRVATDNAETNTAMLAVNATLGFRTIIRYRLGVVHLS